MRLCVSSTLIGSLMLVLTTGCATEPKAIRPIPGGRFNALDLEYIYPVPPAHAYDALLGAFRSAFDTSVSLAERENPEKLRRFRRYGEVNTDYLYYEEQGKKYRKQCDGYVRVIPDHPNYSDVRVGCKYDVYEFGFTRGGIHNLFTQWWDWYPENHLYVAEDMLELIRDKLKLGRDDIIRLSNLKVNELPDVVLAIGEYEAKKKQK